MLRSCCIRKDDMEQDLSIQQDSSSQHTCKHEHGASDDHLSQYNHPQHHYSLVDHFTSVHLGHTHSEHSSQQQDHEREQQGLLSKQCEQTIYQWHM